MPTRNPDKLREKWRRNKATQRANQRARKSQGPDDDVFGVYG